MPLWSSSRFQKYDLSLVGCVLVRVFTMALSKHFLAEEHQTSLC